MVTFLSDLFANKLTLNPPCCTITSYPICIATTLSEAFPIATISVQLINRSKSGHEKIKLSHKLHVRVWKVCILN